MSTAFKSAPLGAQVLAVWYRTQVILCVQSSTWLGNEKRAPVWLSTCGLTAA